jgi:putative MATE family efflux protein
MARIKALFGGPRDVDMTVGSITKHLISFSLPLLIGNIFQQLYNTVDTWVVGNFVSNEAYSAVGTVGPIINMLIGFFLGLSSGAGVVISQYYGAKQHNRVHDTVHTVILMTLVLGVVFTVLGIIMIPFALRLMNTPTEVIPESTTYLTIYFGGVLGLMIYNMGAGILRAVGDSRHPFYYLVVSAVLNTVLDLVFVLKFGMGVEGVAWATIIAQGISAILVLLQLMRTDSCIRLQWRHLTFCWDMLAKIFKVGFPAAIQMAVTSFSNVFVQSYINFFGADCMSGWTSYTKIDQLILLPMQSIALAATTFVGQNLGMNNVARAKKGVSTALLIACISTFVLMIPVMIFAPGLNAFFNSKPQVVEYGTLLLRYISPFYLLCCINQIYAGALRGSGNSRVPMIIMLLSFVAFRQCYLYIMANYISNEFLPIALSYPAGWFVCSALTLLYYRKAQLADHRLVDDVAPV